MERQNQHRCFRKIINYFLRSSQHTFNSQNASPLLLQSLPPLAYRAHHQAKHSYVSNDEAALAPETCYLTEKHTRSPHKTSKHIRPCTPCCLCASLQLRGYWKPISIRNGFPGLPPFCCQKHLAPNGWAAPWTGIVQRSASHLGSQHLPEWDRVPRSVGVTSPSRCCGFLMSWCQQEKASYI